MIGKMQLREMFQTRKPRGFVTDIWHALGLADQHGRRHIDPSTDQPVLKKDKATIDPREFSLRGLAEAILGEDGLEMLNPGGMDRYHRLLEAGPGAVGVSAFANINAFTATVAGLIEYKILEAYQMPEFIRENLVETIPTGVFSARKYIGLGGFADAAEERKPGMPLKMANFGERWIESQDNKEKGLGVEVTFEAVALDLTGDMLTQAAKVGERIGYDQELEAIDMVIGVTGSLYKYKGTSFNTYYAAGGGGPTDALGNESAVNNAGTNELADWTDVNNALQLFYKMTDPTTGRRIFVNPTTLLVMPAKLATARKVIRDTTVELRTGSGNFATNVSAGANPFKDQYDVLTSPLIHQRATDADGLNLSSANADLRWWFGDFKKAFGYEQFHPLVVDQATPATYDMLSRRIVAAYFARRRGAYFVKDPRYSVVSTH